MTLPPLSLSSLSARVRSASGWPLLRSPGIGKITRSVSVTLVGQSLLLGGLVWITRASVSFGTEGFGEYQVARRTIAVIALPLMCGLGISLPRFIAAEIEDRRLVALWLQGGGLLAIALLAVFLLAGTLLSPVMANCVFANRGDPRLTFGLLVAIPGVFLHTLVNAALRGLSRFRAAAVWQVANGAAIPLLAILFARGRVPRALSLGGVLWCGLSLAVYLGLCGEWASRHQERDREDPGLTDVLRRLLIFGAPRVPGDLALFGLFACPAYHAVHAQDLAGAGFLSVGLSLIQAVASVFASAGFVLLPYWSRAVRSPASLGIAHKRMVVVVVSSGIIAALAVGLLELFLHPLLHLLLGPLAEAGLTELRIVIAGAVPYVLYLVLRDYLDALSVLPMNTLALCTAILAEETLVRLGALSIAAATTAGFLALGAAMVLLWTIMGRWPGSLDPVQRVLSDGTS